MKILVLPGDGIGPEITAATLDVLGAADRAFGLGLKLEVADIGFASLATQGTTLPDAVLARVPEVDGVILGPVSHYDYPTAAEGGVNPSGALRRLFVLGANIRPARTRPGVGRIGPSFDLVIVREATEGFYADRNMHAGVPEFMTDPDTALSVRKITAGACRRVALAAFELSRGRRGKVTAVHKANILRLTDGLFLREVRAVASDYPDVFLDEVIVDAAAALLVRDPGRFDVMVTTNMFGDILSDAASELAGGLGLGGSLNVGEDVCVAQAQHGSAPDIAGRNAANPTSLIASAAMLLRWRGGRDADEGLVRAADRIDRALDAALASPAKRTEDVGGRATTSEFTAAVVAELRNCAE